MLLDDVCSGTSRFDVLWCCQQEGCQTDSDTRDVHGIATGAVTTTNPNAIVVLRTRWYETEREEITLLVESFLQQWPPLLLNNTPMNPKKKPPPMCIRMHVYTDQTHDACFITLTQDVSVHSAHDTAHAFFDASLHTLRNVFQAHAPPPAEAAPLVMSHDICFLPSGITEHYVGSV